MVGNCTNIRAGAVYVMLIIGGQVQPLHAVTSRDVDMLPDDIMAPTVSPLETERRPPQDFKRDPGALGPSSKESPAPVGNPLWSVPLSRLSVTRERPIFSASRRPPPQAVAGPIVEPVKPPAPVSVLEPLNLKLIGAVVGETDAIAVFVDRASKGIVRMRRGDTYAGWQLSSIAGREATLKNGDRIETVGIVKSEAPATAESGSPPPAIVSGTSFAPFIPRSTPKNGEPDGL